MTVITARTSPPPSPSTAVVPQIAKVGSGLICGEDLRAGAACFIKASDGKVYMSGGSGVTAITDEGAAVHGFCAIECKVGSEMPADLMDGVDFGYSTGMTPGKRFYLDVSAATKGRLNDAQGIAGLPVVAFAIDATRIRAFRGIPHVTPDT